MYYSKIIEVAVKSGEQQNWKFSATLVPEEVEHVLSAFEIP